MLDFAPISREQSLIQKGPNLLSLSSESSSLSTSERISRLGVLLRRYHLSSEGLLYCQLLKQLFIVSRHSRAEIDNLYVNMIAFSVVLVALA